jgi:hypothetical protein
VVGTLRRRVAIAVVLRIRASISGFALPGLRKENLELLPLSASSMGLRARASLYHYSRTASEDRATTLGQHPPVALAFARAFLYRYSRTASEDRATTLGQHPPVALASEPVRCFIAIRARPRRALRRR